MKAKYSKTLAPLVLGATLFQITACGVSGGGEKTGSQSSPEPRQFEAEAEGTYVAQLQTLNNGVGGPISGNVSINKEGTRFIAYVRFSGGLPGIVHQQRVHIGTSCPTSAQDANGDGYIDEVEAFNHAGKILFPLDSDISSQERGSSIWPSGDMYGIYFWERATSFDRFIADLREPDLNEENDYAKLGPNGPLNLDGRVVFIHGAPETSNLPDTVATRGRLRNFQTIPIACGVIKKIATVPGTVEDDPSLGPATGDATGGSSGADDGAIVPVDGVSHPSEETGGATGGATTGATGSTSGSSDTNTDDDHTTSGSSSSGWHWPWERHPTETTGGSSGGTTGGETSGGSTSGGTTSGDTTSGETTGGTTGG